MRAQKPLIPGKCWGCLRRTLGWCDKNARPGKLTCWFHRDAEGMARRLAKVIEETGAPPVSRRQRKIDEREANERKD